MFSEAEALIDAEDWAQGGEQFNLFRRAVEHHFSMEEEVLFPRFERQTGLAMGPTQVMRMEHIQMRKLFGEMEEAIAAKRTDDYLGFAETLMMIMQQHNMKEERMLYPMTDQALTSQADDVLAEMAALEE